MQLLLLLLRQLQKCFSSQMICLFAYPEGLHGFGQEK